jgi:hypothetical protein
LQSERKNSLDAIKMDRFMRDFRAVLEDAHNKRVAWTHRRDRTFFQIITKVEVSSRT